MPLSVGSDTKFTFLFSSNRLYCRSCKLLVNVRTCVSSCVRKKCVSDAWAAMACSSYLRADILGFSPKDGHYQTRKLRVYYQTKSIMIVQSVRFLCIIQGWENTSLVASWLSASLSQSPYWLVTFPGILWRHREVSAWKNEVRSQSTD